jgi:valyl-tRNA synthetase
LPLFDFYVLANFRFDLLAQTLYDFVWGEYCDWYVEAAKIVLYDKEASSKQIHAALHTLVNTLETICLHW